MSELEEGNEPTGSVELYLNADRKIEKIINDVTDLIKQDMGLDHKLDMVMQQQAQLKEGFSFSRETGHKTWEATQRIEANIEKLNTRIVLAENLSAEAIKTNEKMEKKFDKYVLGMIVTVFCTILLTIMTFLLKWKP